MLSDCLFINMSTYWYTVSSQLHMQLCIVLLHAVYMQCSVYLDLYREKKKIQKNSHKGVHAISSILLVQFFLQILKMVAGQLSLVYLAYSWSPWESHICLVKTGKKRDKFHSRLTDTCRLASALETCLKRINNSIIRYHDIICPELISTTRLIYSVIVNNTVSITQYVAQYLSNIITLLEVHPYNI